MSIHILHYTITKADNDDKQSSQGSLEGRDQLGKDQQARRCKTKKHI